MSVEDQFEGDERALLKHIQELLDVRMKDKRKRYVHSLGVAETALHLAEVYGVDRFDAAAAGLIHDWDKVLSDDELVTRALHYGIKIAGSPSAAASAFWAYRKLRRKKYPATALLTVRRRKKHAPTP